MELVKVKFTRAQNVANVGTYREGEIAGFTKTMAEAIVKRGAAEYYSDSEAKKTPAKTKPQTSTITK